MTRCAVSLRRLMLIGAAALAVLGEVPAGASANVPVPGSISLPVNVIPALGGWQDGTATFSVVFDGTTATATATATGLGLGAGNVFHVDTCIKAHAMNPYSYSTTCQQKTVDTTGNTAPIYLPAATATTSIPRPPSGASAYLSFIVSISTRQPDNSFKPVASSWPAAGLNAASVGVPAVDVLTAPAPVSEGLMLTNGLTGGINSGQPDSFCEGFQYPPPAPPGSGVSTTVLGPNAPAYYEVGDPTGTYAGQPPRGVMLLIHGGGWFMNGPAMVATERGEADQWRAQGWETVNLTYRPCYQSFADVQWFYDQARQLFGSSVPYCAFGASAGGHLALTLAASRPSVACVISEAGPTDGVTIKGESTPVGSTNGPRWVYNLLAAAISPEMVPWWSPARFAIHARVLWAIAAGDPYIPWAQGTELQSNMLAANPAAYVDLLQLASGTTPWVHANISAGALATFQSHEQQLVAPLVGS